MDEQSKVEVMTFYKQLVNKEIIETQRLEVYKQEALTIEATLEPERAMANVVRTQQQAQFLEKIRQVQKDLVNQLYGFAQTVNDLEGQVLTMCIFQGRGIKEVAEATERSVQTIKNVKCKLMKELNELVVETEL